MPFAENAQRQRMLALYALGRQHEALEKYHQFRARLDDELGLAPTPATRAVESAILLQEDVRGLLPRPLAEHGTGGARGVRLLGRTNELAALERAVRTALDGSFALVRIEGEAGFGKTRLLDELASALAGARVGRARCSPLEQHLPYVPLAAALRDAAEEGELERLRVPGLRPIFPEPSADGGAPPPSEVEALEALVDLVTEHAPLVLLIDDLQWGDTSTIAAVSYLRRRCVSVPAAVVVVSRLDEAPPGHPLQGLEADVVVRLGPLTAAEIAPLGIAGLHTSTGGNPRFIAEAVAHPGTPALDSAFSEALIAQCRAQGAGAYRALQVASVLDQPFEPERLALLLRSDPAELVEELDRLCERRILRVDGPRFLFRYPLVRDVLAASLSPARKQMLHRELRRTPGPGAPARPVDTERFVLDGR